MHHHCHLLTLKLPDINGNMYSNSFKFYGELYIKLKPDIIILETYVNKQYFIQNQIYTNVLIMTIPTKKNYT